MAYNNPLDSSRNSNKIASLGGEDSYSKEQRVLEEKHIKENANLKKLLELNGIKENSREAKRLAKELLEYQNKEKKELELKQRKELEKWEDKQFIKETKRKKEALEEEKKFREEMFQAEMDNYDMIMQSSSTKFGEKLKAGFDKAKASLLNGLTSGKITEAFGKGMQETMHTFAKYQSNIMTRLQGSTYKWLGATGLRNSLATKVGITPFIKTQEMYDNLQTFVQQGIAFNLEQRTFLATITDKVAATFDAFDSNLSRIIRLQQADSTAARLGMEAYMTQFLNNMFSNTEYLSTSFDTVTQNLVEATSQMGADMAVQFEYIAQKWLGSLSSVGLSDSAISNLSQALGYLATGDVTGMQGSAMQNLIVMAASRAGLSYADMLSRGIELDETNQLLASVVGYLQEIGSSTNKVVKNQMAQTFGVSVSDLAAAGNLTSKDISTIASNLLSYTGAINELQSQLGQVASRTHTGEMLENVMDNAKFSLYSNIAGNPALYALWQVTDMIQGYTGGINIPAISVMGNMVDLNTTVENLMKLGIMGIGSLGMIGDVVNGIGNTFNFAGTLGKLGIGTQVVTTSRGAGNIASRSSGFSTSSSAYVGQSSGDVFYQSTLSGAKQEAQEEVNNQASKTTTLDDVITKLTDGSAKAKVDYIEEGKLVNNITSVNQTLNDMKTTMETIRDYVNSINDNVDRISTNVGLRYGG